MIGKAVLRHFGNKRFIKSGSPKLHILNILKHQDYHRIHVWYIYLHLLDFYEINVGKYASPVDPVGETFQNDANLHPWSIFLVSQSCFL